MQDRYNGPNGAAYFVNGDPRQQENMAQAFQAMQSHAKTAWEPVVAGVKEGLKDTPFTVVSVDHTGGGCYTLFAVTEADRDLYGTDSQTGPQLVAGPFTCDPTPEWAWTEESTGFQRTWDDDNSETWETIAEESDRLTADDLPRYTELLTAALLRSLTTARNLGWIQ